MEVLTQKEIEIIKKEINKKLENTIEMRRKPSLNTILIKLRDYFVNLGKDPRYKINRKSYLNDYERGKWDNFTEMFINQAKGLEYFDYITNRWMNNPQLEAQLKRNTQSEQIRQTISIEDREERNQREIKRFETELRVLNEIPKGEFDEKLIKVLRTNLKNLLNNRPSESFFFIINDFSVDEFKEWSKLTKTVKYRAIDILAKEEREKNRLLKEELDKAMIEANRCVKEVKQSPEEKLVKNKKKIINKEMTTNISNWNSFVKENASKVDEYIRSQGVDLKGTKKQPARLKMLSAMKEVGALNLLSMEDGISQFMSNYPDYSEIFMKWTSGIDTKSEEAVWKKQQKSGGGGAVAVIPKSRKTRTAKAAPVQIKERVDISLQEDIPRDSPFDSPVYNKALIDELCEPKIKKRVEKHLKKISKLEAEIETVKVKLYDCETKARSRSRLVSRQTSPMSTRGSPRDALKSRAKSTPRSRKLSSRKQGAFSAPVPVYKRSRSLVRSRDTPHANVLQKAVEYRHSQLPPKVLQTPVRRSPTPVEKPKKKKKGKRSKKLKDSP